jgi:hypothetical protein
MSAQERGFVVTMERAALLDDRTAPLDHRITLLRSRLAALALPVVWTSVRPIDHLLHLTSGRLA